MFLAKIISVAEIKSVIEINHMKLEENNQNKRANRKNLPTCISHENNGMAKIETHLKSYKFYRAQKM